MAGSALIALLKNRAMGPSEAPEASPDSSDTGMDPGLVDAASDILDAIKSGDPTQLAGALQDFNSNAAPDDSDSEPDTEAPEGE